TSLKLAPKNNRRSSGNWKGDLDALSSQAAVPLVSVKEFNPVGSPRRVASPISKPRTSSLSASLATSSFHHPKAAEESRNGSSTSPPSHSTNRSSPLSSNSYSSLSSHSSNARAIRAVEDDTYADGTYITPFRRNIDQGTDTATSFRYFTILEADTARKHGKANGTSEEVDAESARGAENDGASAVEGVKADSAQVARPHKTTDDDDVSGQLKDGSKSKRKVTFDVKPDVVTIKRDIKSEAREEETVLVGRAAEGQCIPEAIALPSNTS
ncbi:hypothetical protein HWV62_8645, partial [Athelia sp. TMB]